MTKSFYLEIPIWEASVLVCLGPPDAKFKRLAVKYAGQHRTDKFLKGIEELMGRCMGGQPAFVYVNKIPKTPSDINTLVHEVNHLADGLLYRKGMTFSSHSEEAYCYLKGWLVEQILIKAKQK